MTRSIWNPLVLLTVLLTAGAFSRHAHGGASSSIVVSDAWARPSINGVSNGAGYFTVTNLGSTGDALLGIRTDVAEAAELHSMTMQGNMMMMAKLEKVEIPPHGRIAFAPGHDHIMFLRLNKPLVAGGSFPVVFLFQHAGEIPARMTIQNTAPEPEKASVPPAADGMHNMHGMERRHEQR